MSGITVSPRALQDPAGSAVARLELIHHPIVRVVVRRLAMAIPLLFIVSASSFVLVSLTPGDAAQTILGLNAPRDAVVRLHHALGLDNPLYVQYWDWLKHAVRGDFGTSVVTGETVTHAIDARLPPTFALIVGAFLLGTTIGIGLGVLSALRGGALGRAVDAFALAGFAVPAFWLGAILIAVFAVKLRWFPATGYVSFADSPSGWINSLVLPVVALSLGAIAAIAKQTRASMLEVLSSEHIRIAWANGLSPRSIVFRHALKNAALPVITVIGVQAVWLLGGTVVIESVFALPGLGSLLVNASIQHDLPVVEGIAIYFTVIIVLISLLTDLAYSWLNPRVRTQ